MKNPPAQEMHETSIKQSFFTRTYYAERKTFAELDKSKEAEVHFLENIGFLIVKNTGLEFLIY